MNRRRMAAAGVVVAAVTVGGVAGALIGIPGLSGASSGTSTSTGTAQSGNAPRAGRHFRGFVGIGAGKDVLDAAAKALDLSTDGLLQKLSDGKTTIADVAKQQNVDVQTVVDAMEAVAKDDIQNLVNNPLPVPPRLGDGPMGGLGLRFGFGGPLHESLDSVAKALGITTDELRTDLRNGQSIADIAKAKSVDVSTIVDTLVNDAKSRLDDAVKAGELTQDRANQIESDLKDRITELVNNAFPGGPGDFGRFRLHGRFGPDGPRPGPGADAGSAAVPAA